MSATSPSCISVSVVMHVPNPRARAASMNDHTAGSTDASIVTARNGGWSSMRGEMHGMRKTGTRSRWSARYCDDAWTRGWAAARGSPSREVVRGGGSGGDVGVPRAAIDLGDGRPLVGVGDHDEAPELQVAAGRRLQGDLEALLDQLEGHRPVEVEPTAHGPRRGEQLVGVGDVDHRGPPGGDPAGDPDHVVDALTQLLVADPLALVLGGAEDVADGHHRQGLDPVDGGDGVEHRRPPSRCRRARAGPSGRRSSRSGS